MAPFEALQPGIESALLLVQQTVEEHNGRLQIIVWTLLRLSRSPLLLPPLAFLGTIQIAARQFPAVEPVLLHQVPQGIFGGQVHHRVQFVGEVTRWGVGHQRCRGVQQGAVTRKMNVAIRPQPQFIVLGDGIQRIISPPMGIAAAVSHGCQLAQDGEGDGGAQGAFELQHGGDFLLPQEAHQSVTRVANDIHNVNMTLFRVMSSVIFTF